MSTAKTPRPAPRGGRPRNPATDQAINAATLRLLYRNGYQGLSVEAVAAEAGVAKTTVYRRHASKRDLVVGALAANAALPSVPPELPTREALAAVVNQSVLLFIAARAVRIVAALLTEEEREPELLDTVRARIVEPRRKILVAVLQAGIDRGEVSPDTNLDVVTEMVIGSVFANYIRGAAPDAAWIDAVVETIWRAIRTR